jgi:hypothetical protein
MFHAIAENYPCYIHYDASTRFHVHAHRQICQYQGLICQTDGEMIEREWTTHRPAANVEGMKPGKRSPLIDLDSPLLVSDYPIIFLLAKYSSGQTLRERYVVGGRSNI